MKHTLKAAIDAGAREVRVYCISCCNSKAYTPERALDLWGSEATFPEIARRSKCRQCGRQASQAAPDWPPESKGRGGEPSVTPKGWENLRTENPARIKPRA